MAREELKKLTLYNRGNWMSVSLDGEPAIKVVISSTVDSGASADGKAFSELRDRPMAIGQGLQSQ